MARPKKYKLEIWVKSAPRAIGIINRLWAIGELTDVQRINMIAKIDSKKLDAENEKNKKFQKLTAHFRQFYKHYTADSQNNQRRKENVKQG